MPGGNTISLAQLGPLDRVAPSPVAASSVQSMSVANQVQLRTGARWMTPTVSAFAATSGRATARIDTTETPEWIDTAVTVGASYTYAVHSLDLHANISTDTTFTVTTPAMLAIDPREIGLRTTGSYWEGMGEQIDMRSGNLIVSLPLLNAQSRGWSVPLGLTYNPQNRENDNNGNTWKLGEDTGYGFGWKLQLGSSTALFSDYWTVQFYEFRDASGAIYRLDQNSSGIWMSKESIYVTYDANTQHGTEVPVPPVTLHEQQHRTGPSFREEASGAEPVVPFR
jgi:hypothetical protein